MRKKQTNIELLFLGSGNGFTPGRAYGSFLVDGRILFEAAPTTLPAVNKLGISLEDIQYLFISHFHADHCFGLPFIFLDHYFMTRRKNPLMIIGPKGIKKFSNNLMDLAFPDTRKKYSKNFPVEYLEVSPGKAYALRDMTFKTYQMFHFDTRVIGFSLFYKHRRLAYSGDTGPCQGLTDLLNGVDIAVLEMTSLDDDLPSHLNQQNILEIRRQLPPETKLVLTHLPSLSRKQAKDLVQNPYGAIVLAEDFKRFNFSF
jgi:ribonuclease BN (tRNA processing enzyme)